MVLEGVVTNVAAFGAFVDIGVHQDGLVHVSAMSRTFVSDPHSVVKSGDVVRVKVLSVDIPRNRISLTLRLDDDAAKGLTAAGQSRRPSAPDAGRAAQPRSPPGLGPGLGQRGGGGRSGRGRRAGRGGARDAAPEGALADALRRAGPGP